MRLLGGLLTCSPRKFFVFNVGLCPKTYSLCLSNDIRIYSLCLSNDILYLYNVVWLVVVGKMVHLLSSGVHVH